MAKVKCDETIKAIRFETEAGFTFNDAVAPAIVLVKVDHEVHEISFCQVRGGSVSIGDFVDFCIHDRDVRKELRWAQWAAMLNDPDPKVSRYKWYGRIKEGVSGCKDYVLSRSLSSCPSWAAFADIRATEVVRKVHVSMYGKLNEGIPSMDAFELRAFLSLYFGGRERLQEILVDTIGQIGGASDDDEYPDWSYTDIKPVYGEMLYL